MSRVVGTSSIVGMISGAGGVALSFSKDALPLNLGLFWSTAWVPSLAIVTLGLALSGLALMHAEQLLAQFRGKAHQVHGFADASTEAILGEVRARLRKLSKARHPDAVGYLDEVLAAAATVGASDVHLTPEALGTLLTFRIDGSLHAVLEIEGALGRTLVNRIKVLCDMRLDRRGESQDGRLSRNVGGRTLDLRVSTLPTDAGERVVMRLVSGSVSLPEFDQLGFAPRVHDALASVLGSPQGILFVTGPVGSGKTTTLYSALKYIKDFRGSTSSIVSLEDPIEQRLEFVAQTEIDAAHGRGFAQTLRSVLRQDPNVLMVGEIRDRETAEVAINAGLSGHLILTTVHAADAAGAFVRLTELGVAPEALASASAASLSQRLTRALCPACRVRQDPSAGTRQRFASLGAPLPDAAYFEPVGCPVCEQQGYSGRRPLSELLVVDEPLRQEIARRASPDSMRRLGRSTGYASLIADGVRLAAGGETSLSEVLRVAG
jgi:general secretion pathway protein E